MVSGTAQSCYQYLRFLLSGFPLPCFCMNYSHQQVKPTTQFLSSLVLSNEQQRTDQNQTSFQTVGVTSMGVLYFFFFNYYKSIIQLSIINNTYFR